MRFMFLIHTAADAAPTPSLMQAMHELATEEIAAGRMIYDAGLAPPSAGMQLRMKSGWVVVLDGPFAETKEVVGGFAIFELPDMAAAEESARRFLALHAEHMPGWEGTCEIRIVGGSQVERSRAAGATAGG